MKWVIGILIYIGLAALTLSWCVAAKSGDKRGRS
jgi:hypothetical protein